MPPPPLSPITTLPPTMEKCTESEFTETWNGFGEEAFRDNLMKMNKTVAKKDIAQKVINALMPALHLVRSDIANGELLEALVANSEAKAHALHKNYMEAIAGLRESMADSKTRVDARIDVSEINYKAFHGHVLQSLSTIANNQQAIVEMVHQLRVHSAMQAAAYYQPPDQYARGGLPPPLPPWTLRKRKTMVLRQDNPKAHPLSANRAHP